MTGDAVAGRSLRDETATDCDRNERRRGLRFLDRSVPNLEKAKEQAFRRVVADGHRAGAVVESIRASLRMTPAPGFARYDEPFRNTCPGNVAIEEVPHSRRSRPSQQLRFSTRKSSGSCTGAYQPDHERRSRDGRRRMNRGFCASRRRHTKAAA